MSIIKPFRGIRYDTDGAGDISDLIAPPYDIISSEARLGLLKRSPVNIIRLILGKDRPEDTDKDNKYARAAALWKDWQNQGLLARDPGPRLYRYMMSFHLKTPQGIEKKVRPGFVALMKLHEYADGKVLPHERTLAGPKQDRFALMAATHAHLSQVFMLYPDPEGVVDGALSDSAPEGIEQWSCEDDAGVTHSMWPVEDEGAIGKVMSHLERHPVYIADGHHRYETALAYRRHLVRSSPLFARGSDYCLAYFTPAEHQGLVVFPYHRLVHNLPKRRLSGFHKKLSSHFQIDQALISPLEPGAPRREFMHELTKRGCGGTVLGMVEGATGRAYYLSLKSDSPGKRDAVSEVEMILAGLDVVVLEDLVLTAGMGIKPKDLLTEKYITYETDYDRVLDAVQKEPNQLTFLLNPTPVADVIRVADLAGVMPEKSTYFFPKLATGLVMHDMDD